MADYCRAQFDAATRARRVNFRFGSDELRASSFALLDALVEILADCPPAILVVTGHTDASGHPAFNLDLSRRRAAAVVDYIARRGISGNRLSARGVGASEPLDDSDSSAARARNRRIEFELVFR